MILDSTTKKIQILLGAVKTTTDCPVVVDYVDLTDISTNVGLQLSNTNGLSAVDILSAPGASTQRKVNFLSVCNKDTDWINLTIRLNDNNTLYNYVTSLQLAPNSTLHYTDVRGWIIVDQGGNTVVTSGSLVDIQTFTANGVWTKPTSATYCLIDICGGGGGGGGGSSAASGVTAGGGGGGGGKRVKMQFLASYLPPKVSVSVGASTGTTAVETDGIGGNVSQFGLYLIGYGGGGGAWNNDTTAAGGGGGAGGTAFGTSATTGQVAGGQAMDTSAAASSYSDDRGAGSSVTAAIAGSYLGGGCGGSSIVSTYIGLAGGSSFFSGAGGGGGGSSDGAINYAGGAGGNTGSAVTGAGNGGTAGTAVGGNGGNGADGNSTKCGQGGGGGGSNFAGTGGNGGNGGALGGGGGGGGGGTTGGLGGSGGRGEVTIISW